MTSRLALLAFSVLPLIGMTGRTRAAESARPNVLFICVDDLKPVLGCYGDKLARSPNIDRLAKRGIVFEMAYCNQALCSPSRNSLMTGLRPTSMGIYDLTTNFREAMPDAVTVAQYFQRHGYRTEAVGKIMHPSNGNHEDAASWSVPLFWADSGTYLSRKNRSSTRANQASKPLVFEEDDVPDSFYFDGRVADEAIKRLGNAKSKPDEPQFLAVGFLKPHLPFRVPKKYWDLHDRSKFKLAENPSAPLGAPAFAGTNSEELRSYREIPATALPDELQRKLIHGYYAAVSYMDAQVGRLLDELDRLGLAEKTVIVLWGDHGWHLGDHSLWGKKTNYEAAARIPLIVAGPGIARSATSSALVETVDLYPTLAELAGLPAPIVTQKLEGRSFATTARDPRVPTKDAVFHAYPRNRKPDGQVIGRAVRTERYRLVEWKKPGAAPGTATLELYDYATDPLETKNLADEKPRIVEELRRVLATQPEALPQFHAPR
ncbi:MAG: sulfatase [Opitutaceae bacterium]|nr:sulfatase [Opitutaceae bacterium]